MLTRLKSGINQLISTLRDRRTRVRQRLEDLFNREVASTILVIGPLGKAVELYTIGEWGYAVRFVGLSVLGVFIAIYWHHLAAAAQEAADAVEEVTED